LAIGISAVTADNQYVIKGAFSANTENDSSGAVSVGFQW
jgi:autotransporter adhesin